MSVAEGIRQSAIVATDFLEKITMRFTDLVYYALFLIL
jgi:hypothetical protein